MKFLSVVVKLGSIFIRLCERTEDGGWSCSFFFVFLFFVGAVFLLLVGLGCGVKALFFGLDLGRVEIASIFYIIGGSIFLEEGGFN